jgi:lipoate-protein ligase A
MILHLLELHQVPILTQLKLEEALLRAHDESFCIINHGSERSVVMGCSGIPEELLYLDQMQKESIPLIKRFSGGGTVIVDEQTLFVSFLIAKEDLSIAAFPEPILEWGAELYQEAWQLPDFSLRENDFALGERKCGGNALYIRKDRWLLHTSFLWDYSEKNMTLLKLPKKRPLYRQDRSHTHFLARLNTAAPSLGSLISRLKAELVKRFDMRTSRVEELFPILERDHRKTTELLPY